MANERLQKVLAAAGVDSRRNCEELILQGLVKVKGKVVQTLPVFVDTDHDVVTFRGRKLRAAKKVYYLLNKPRGVICTNSDPKGRTRAIDLVPSKERIYCIGRLDADTTGLIILTNDSELTNKLTHPSYKVPKTYVATVQDSIEDDTVRKLKSGIWLAEGKTAGASIKVLHRGHSEAMLEITIRQGLNRQVRRMLARVGLRVKSLRRTKIGRITTRKLGMGRFRNLTKTEVAYLSRITDRK